ncbi:hypothetical protein, variant [Exophiala mesophila]|uniref:FAD-binding domain-containing protein n=1 Tax=Exophiala mesophila TaxID=212818 RepID=A0A0D1ZB23_EXOME|nr:uncharacterized protein PV10_05748 [Exophiala mesophila]XP_016222758.1 hypothetical protein, variant [Exophiala mesophila]KIV91183.1 hypothetical protein PV10_05748 [Exophiala mesophila]KIV91184.1 hypothetical protein, variant [Exophiala mesophila]
MAASEAPWAIIVGAGPSGLLLALMLARKGVPVHVLEASNELDDSPRAAYYGPPAAYELRRAGVIDDVRKEGFDPVITCWRKLDGTYLGGFDNSINFDDPDRLATLPLAQLDRLLYRHVSAHPSAKVSFNHKVVDLGQDKDKAWVDVETPEGNKRLEATYIVGCDGASSTVRRKLYGDTDFPGYTWDKQIVATNVAYPFEKFGYEDVQFFIHPEHWHMVARLTKNPDNSGFWRVSYGEISGLTREQLLERQPMKFEAMLPGHPKKGEYTLAAINPYRIHQRLVESLHVGRFLLAADAAHICNPFGGLGLTGGIVDVGGLYDCMIGIYEGKADDSILDRYSEVRREKYLTITDPISTDNIKRLYDQDPDKALENDPLLKLLNGMKDDKEAQREFMKAPFALSYDFTQHYNTKQAKCPEQKVLVQRVEQVASAAAN